MTAFSVAHNAGRPPSGEEERKLRKPVIERKRRERINHCLDQLKETVIGAFSLDQSKLEKADILEMTVNTCRTSRVINLMIPRSARRRSRSTARATSGASTSAQERALLEMWRPW
ncbi:hypothetical protein NHX12_008702 [Muraenolepis orangiensis]|uniref:BHLH domain-containing protein n=1 Tax=Muraenolepis orangiensis TaxID=630683 RepID=A0A9Q0DLU8_9TELE|nr:hypothetical protein NHX12_008702 [Muraenolepis orangiensis]